MRLKCVLNDGKLSKLWAILCSFTVIHRNNTAQYSWNTSSVHSQTHWKRTSVFPDPGIKASVPTQHEFTKKSQHARRHCSR